VQSQIDPGGTRKAALASKYEGLVSQMKVETETTAVDTQQSGSRKRKHHKTVGYLVLVFGITYVLIVR
jgi:hypothetical protein